MSNRFKAVVVAAACLVCCIPLVLGIVGATSGFAGAAGLWFRRYDLAVIAGVGLTAVLVLAYGRRPSQNIRQQSADQ